MADAATTDQALSAYVDSCNADPRLGRVLKGWDRVVRFRASDTGEQSSLSVEGARMVAGESADGRPVLVVTTTSDLLVRTLRGEVNPIDLYTNGDLTVQGSPDDVFRLDTISAVLWGDS